MPAALVRGLRPSTLRIGLASEIGSEGLELACSLRKAGGEAQTFPARLTPDRRGLECLGVALADDGEFRVELLANGVLVPRFCESEEVHVVSSASISAGKTWVLSTAGGFEVALSGTGLEFLRGPLRCQFGDVDAGPARVHTDDEIVCVSPAVSSPARTALVLVDAQGGVLETHAQIEFVEPLSIEQVKPTLLPETGGTEVIVRVKGDTRGRMVQCQFGNVKVDASAGPSHDIVSCLAPRILPGQVNLSLLVGGQEVVMSADPLTFTPQVSVTSLSPSAGLFRGGATVTVRGTGFGGLGPLFCSFAPGVSSPATFVDGETLVCSTPAFSTGERQQVASLKILGGESGAVEVARLVDAFVFYEEPQIRDVFPHLLAALAGSQDPVLVSVLGTAFPPFDGASCRLTQEWRASLHDARRHSEGRLDCVVDASLLVAGDATLEVSFDGVRYFDAGKIIVHPGVEVHSVHPRRLGDSGGNLVTLRGSGFLRSADLRCRFGIAGIVDAEFVDSSTLRCVSPPHKPGPALLSVSVNGRDYSAPSRSTSVEFAVAFEVRSLTPRSGSRMGGTEITASGANFDVDAPLLCRFRGTAPDVIKLVPARPLSSSQIVCITPSWAGERGEVIFDVIDASHERAFGTDFSARTTLHFAYHADAQINRIEPAFGPSHGGTEIHVHGASFIVSQDLQCVFDGATWAAATYVSSAEVICTTPAGPRDTVSRVQVTNDGSSLSPPLQYTYVGPVEARYLHPTIVSTSLPSAITVVGSGFRDSALLRCKIANLPASLFEATYVDEHRVRCTWDDPLLRPGSYEVLVANNGHDFESTALIIEAAVERPELIRSRVPKTGGDIVRVGPFKTRRLETARAVFCDFEGDRSTAALDETGTFVDCTMPAFLAAGPRALSIFALAGDELAQENLLWHEQAALVVHEALQITSILPRSLSWHHATQARLTLANALDESLVQDIEIELTYENGHAIVVPVTGAGPHDLYVEIPALGDDGLLGSDAPVVPVGLRVRLDGVPGTSQVPARAVHRAEPVLVAMEPRFVVSGADPTPILITIDGTASSLRQDASIECRFGAVRTAATRLGPAKAICNAPAMPAGSVSGVEIALDDAHFSDSGFQLVYLSSVEASEIAPLHVEHRGGTPITIRGHGFAELPEELSLRCRFRVAADPAAVVTTAAMRQSNEMVTCVAPGRAEIGRAEFDVESEAVLVDLVLPGALPGSYIELMRDDADLAFTYVPTSEVVDVWPRTGPARGGSLVYLQGTGFSGLIESVCVFVLAHSEARAVKTPAEHLSDTRVRCETPAQEQLADSINDDSADLALAQVHFSANGVDVSRSFAPFRFEAIAQVERIVPSSGPALGGAVVTIYGKHFVDAVNLRCRFGMSSPAMAIFVSATEIRCVAPEAAHNGPVAVGVATNGIDYSTDLVMFTYTESPLVFAVIPSSGPMTGGTEVRVTGANFREGVACQFGTVLVPATRVFGGTELLCLSPPVAMDSRSAGFPYSVGLSVHDSTRTPEEGSTLAWFEAELRASFQYVPEVSLHSIFPPQAPCSGGTTVTIYGTGLGAGSGIEISPTCIFTTSGQASALVPPQSLEVAATMVADDSLTCVVPALDSGACARHTQAQVSVSLNGQDAAHPALSFSYMADPVLSKLSSSRGPARGETMVRVFGENLVRSPLTACRIGEDVIQASYISPEGDFMDCLTPAHRQEVNEIQEIYVTTAETPDSTTYEIDLWSLPSQSEVQRFTLSAQGYDGATGEVAEVQVIRTDGTGPLRGSFKLSFRGEVTVPLAFDESAEGLENALNALTAIENATVERTASADDYAWTVTFAGNAGDLEDLVPDTSRLSGLASDAVGISVTEARAGNSTPIAGGSFALSLNGGPATNVLYDADEDTFKAALESIHSISGIMVARSSLPDRNGAYIWEVTFPGTGPYGLVDVDVSGLAPATGVSCESVRAQQGSTVEGEFVLRFAELDSRALDVNSNADEIETALREDLGVNATVTQSVVSNTTTWAKQIQLTFDDLEGVPHKVEAIIDGLTGALAQTRVRALARGVQELNGSFHVGFRDAWTPRLAFAETSSASLVSALEALPTVGTVRVSEVLHEEGTAGRWRVTFTARGIPANVGPLPLLQVRSDFGVGTKFYLRANRVQEACCSLAVTIDGQQFSEPLSYRYDRHPAVVSVSPRYGAAEGGTEIVLTGAGFYESTSIMCVFNASLETPARAVDENTLVCSTPPLSALNGPGLGAGPVAVKVRYYLGSGAEYHESESSVEFNYSSTLRISQLRPERASLRGGVELVVSLLHNVTADELEAAACLFGDESMVAATLESSASLSCRVPAHAPGPVEVRVTLNGQDLSSNSASFQYDKALEVLGLSVNTGPREGGTPLRIFGVDIPRSDSLLCDFADRGTVGAQWRAENQVACAVPPASARDLTAVDRILLRTTSRETNLQLDAGGPLFSMDADPVEIEAATDCNAFAIVKAFYDGVERTWLAETSCASALTATASETLQVVLLSSDDVVVSLTTNDVEFSSPLLFRVFDVPTVTSVVPQTSPLQGGTVVTLSLDRNASQLAVSCWFGGRKVPGTVTAEGLVVECIAPLAERMQTIALRLSGNDGVDFFPGGVDFEYENTGPAAIFSIWPMSGPASGRTQLALVGDGLERLGLDGQLTYCLFTSGGLTVSTDMTATEDEVAFTCETPSRDEFSDAPPAVALDIGVGEQRQVLTNSHIKFVYDDDVIVQAIDPPQGTRLGGAEILVRAGPVPGSRRDAENQLLCRIGTEVVEAELIEPGDVATLRCPVPARLPDPHVETFGFRGSGPQYRVERLELRSPAPAKEIGTITLQGEAIEPDVQRVKLAGPDAPATYRLSTTLEAADRTQIISIATSSSAIYPEAHLLKVEADVSARQTVATIEIDVVPQPETTEVQIVTVAAEAGLGGEFALVWDGTASSTVPAEGPAESVRAALATIPGLEGVAVTLDTGASIAGFRRVWDVTFPILSATSTVPRLSVDGASLEGTEISASVTQAVAQALNERQLIRLDRGADNVAVALDGKEGAILLSNADLAVESKVLAWLTSIAAFAAGGVSITASPANTDATFVGWEVSFDGVYGDFAPLSISDVNSEVEELRNGTSEVPSGSFDLEVTTNTGAARRVTIPIELIREDELSELLARHFETYDPTLFALSVDRSAPRTGRNGARTYTVRLPPYFDVALGPTNDLRGTGITVSTTVGNGLVSVSGTFRFRIKLAAQTGETAYSSPLSYQASASDVKDEILALVPGFPLGQVVQVDSGPFEYVWRIELLAPDTAYSANDPQRFEVDGSNLTGFTASASLERTSKINEIQTVATDTASLTGRLSGVFGLSLGPEYGLVRGIAYDATAADLEAAIHAQAPQMGSVAVSRTDLARTRYSWQITFLELAGDLPELQVDKKSLHSSLPGDEALVTVEETRQGDGDTLSGAFQVRCLSCAPGEERIEIPFDASAEGMLESINELMARGETASSVQDVSVSAPDLNGARTWTITFAAGPDDPLPPELQVRLGSLAGSGASVTITVLSAPSIAEVQTITASLSMSDTATCVAGDGSFSFGLATSAAYLQGVMESALASGEALTVSRQDSATERVWRVTFRDRVGDVPDTLVICPSAVVSVGTLVQGTGDPLTGAFRLLHDGVESGELAFDATEAEVEAALNAVGIAVLGVNRSADAGFNGGFSWDVTAGRVLAVTPLYAGTLQGTNALARWEAVGPAFEPRADSFALAFNDQYTVSLGVSTTADEMKSALEALENIDVVEVVRSDEAADGAVTWIVSFVPFYEGAFTQQYGEQAELSVKGDKNSVVTVNKDQPGTKGPEGSFVLNLQGGGSEQGIEIQVGAAYSVNARAAVQTALEALYPEAKAGSLRVLQNGPDARTGAVTWSYEMELSGSTLFTPLMATSATVSATVAPTSSAEPELSGGFQVQWASDSGDATPELGVETTSSALATALGGFGGIIDVVVSQERYESGDVVVLAWDITFTSLTDPADGTRASALLAVDDSALSGPTAKMLTVEVVGMQTVNEEQVIALVSAGTMSGEFTITIPGDWFDALSPTTSDASSAATSATIAFDATAAQVEAALQELFAQRGFEEESPVSVVSEGGSSWRVKALGRLVGDLDLLVIDGSGLSNIDTINVDEDIQGTSVHVGGAVELIVRGPCFETECRTRSLGLGIRQATDASAVRDALAALDDSWLHGVKVSLEAGVTSGDRAWSVTFADGENFRRFSVDTDATTLVGARPWVRVDETGSVAPVGAVAVELSINGQDFTSDGVTYEFLEVPVVRGVYPNHGPVDGGTLVLVFGDHLSAPGANNRQLACKFGDAAPREAFAVNETCVYCLSPAVGYGGPRPVMVGVWGGNFVTTVPVNFTYFEPVQVHEISPRLLPLAQATNLRVLGDGFLPTDELLCRFSKAQVDANTKSVLVTATWIDANEIRCAAPVEEFSHPTQLRVEITTNGLDFVAAPTHLHLFTAPTVASLWPRSGAADRVGSELRLRGSGFVDAPTLACRFDQERVVPATFVHEGEIRCLTPVLTTSVDYFALGRHTHDNGEPLFPGAHPFPLYLSRLVDVETTVNGADFHRSGFRFLYTEEARVSAISPHSGYVGTAAGVSLFVTGSGFVNSTDLRCRLGHHTAAAVYLSPTLLLCRAEMILESGPGRDLVVTVSNNAHDFSTEFVTFKSLGRCPGGMYCPSAVQALQCPPGAFCPGMGNGNFTLCPKGTYQPLPGTEGCLRCPIGYACPEEGMRVPRICPAGFVCDVTGIEEPRQPCPEGHFCLEGTATTATTCGDPSVLSSELTPSRRLGELSGTIRRHRAPLGGDYVLGARASACWSNATEDFGLQVSSYPARFWAERHLLPLDSSTPFVPMRGRFCLDDSCLRLGDADAMRVTDYAFEYSNFNLRRPVPCPAGTYCAPGTAVGEGRMTNITTPQPCFENMYCPEGSASPQGVGDCPAGFYCPFGTRLTCPVGTYCPRAGMDTPLPCPPTTYNSMVGQTACVTCPPGYFCPGFGRVDPATCPPGFVCASEGLERPDTRCPAGFFCPNGTMTSDVFRNDTTLRPYPCQPGSYCPGGVGYDEILEGNFLYAQPCAQGFYCELGSTSPKGSGLCPKGFYCPKNASVPIPTDPGEFAYLEGTVQAAKCLPGYYAPTIETVSCYPCPAGTQCVNDGTSEALICPPGSYKTMTQPGESVVCRGCPAGTWSKNWELRESGECTICPPGVTCPMDGMSFPCSYDDLPTPFTPTGLGESRYKCLNKGSNFFYGYLEWPIDARNRGPNLVSSTKVQGAQENITDAEGNVVTVTVQCYTNEQPDGSKVYQRFKDFHGPRYEIQSGGVYHQGYGDGTYEGYFGRGSLYIEQPVSETYYASRNCTPGYFQHNSSTRSDDWVVGTCEADLICAYTNKAEAQPCNEGYICGEGTNAVTALDIECAPGYYCDFGTTTDVSLEAPQGRYLSLCEEGYFCERGTGKGQAQSKPCPVGYFCPTGLGNPYTGLVASDSLTRSLNETTADPFYNYLYNATWDPEGFEPREISEHDDRCFKGINEELLTTYRMKRTSEGLYDGYISVAIANDLLCGRDHKWRLIADTIDRQRCDCDTYKARALLVFDLWSCTHENNAAACASLEDDGDGFLASFSYTTSELKFIQARKLCAHALDPTIECEDYAHGELVERPGNATASGVVYDMNTYCAETDDPDACMLFKFRNDASQTHKRSMAFSSYDDLKSFVYTDGENLIEEDAATTLGARLMARHGVAATATSYNPYDGAFSEQLDLKMACSLTERCTYVDAILYDLWAAVQFIDEFGAEAETLLQSSRLDACSCQDLARCPDGTTSLVGATNIYACVKNDDEVLSRLMPIVPINPLINMSGWEDTLELVDREISEAEEEAGIFGQYVSPDNYVGLGTMALKAWDIAVVTMDLRDVMRNLTYNDHYQLSIYLDCKPCKVRYLCEAVDESERPECCDCSRHGLPYFFEDVYYEPEDYPDNKHALVQVSIAAMRDLEVVFVLELLHGLYYGPFHDISPAAGDVVIHRPSRANWGQRDQFLTVIIAEEFADLGLPYNLPLSMRSSGSAAGTDYSPYEVEDDAFVDRIARVAIGDPEYGTRSNTDFSNATERRRALADYTSLDDLVDGDSNGTDVTLEYVARDPASVLARDEGWWDLVDGEGADFFVLHYLPFFSNCREYDSRIYLSKVLEMHPAPHCTHVSLEETIYVSPYPWKDQLKPQADDCRLTPDELDELYAPDKFCVDSADCTAKEADYPGMSLSCTYEEEIYRAASKTRWYEVAEGTTLFHITKYPVAVDDFVTTEDEKWGRRSNLADLIGTENLIPIEVEEDYGSQENLVPRKVYFFLMYYQYTAEKKSIVYGSVRFDDMCTISDDPAVIEKYSKYNPPIEECASEDFDYTLYFRWSPLGWFDLINTFQFSWDVYALFFAVVGAGSAMVGIVLWVFSRVLTRLKHPPPFKFFSFYRTVGKPSAYGMFLSSVPVALAAMVTLMWFQWLGSSEPAKTPSAPTFEGITGHFQDTLILTDENRERYRKGRMGLVFLVFSLYLMLTSIKLAIPTNRFDERKRDERAKYGVHRGDSDELEELNDDELEESVTWRPRSWKRTHVMLVSLMISLGLLAIFEFSYSWIFETYVMEFLVCFKLGHMMLNLFLQDILRDVLLIAPFVVVIQVVEMTVTMGASDFMDFVVSYEVELGMMLLERLLAEPVLDHFTLMWPKWKLMLRRRFVNNRRKMTRDQRAREEAEWKKVNEMIALETEGVEPLLSAYATYVNSAQALMMAPFVNIFLIVFNKTTEIPDGYGIRETDLKFYFMFSLLIIPFTLAMDIFLLNVQELTLGFKIYEYVSYQQYRFSVRENRWQMDADTVDESIAPKLQYIDSLCFSSQYYFLAGLHAWGIVLLVFGVTVHIRNTYNLFADPMMPAIVLIVWVLCIVFEKLLRRVGDRLRIWRLKSLEGTVDDDVANKLAVGAGRQEDLEQERLELQAMNSERFRHRFLERNRPWILQHLAELLTPRTLQMPGPDGRPNIEYIRDVYNDLIAMGEARRQVGDREDISSDEEDDQEVLRRNWSKAPLSASSKAIAQYWLMRARQRRAFHKLVKGHIAKQVDDTCGQCGRNQQSGVQMFAELADENHKPDSRALDKLIRAYEEAYPGKGFDGALWQAFFRGHAIFTTRCQICLDQQRQAEMAKRREAMRSPGAGRVARAVDISSDEEDEADDDVYDPVIVSRTSVEGRAMTKWLNAARTRLGGDFPRPDAREQMKDYANRMKDAKLRKEARRKSRRAAKSGGGPRGGGGPGAQAEGKASQDPDHDGPAFGQVRLSAASTAILQRWVRSAQASLVAKGKHKMTQVRTDLDGVLDQMREEDDWFFSADFRQDGLALQREGVELRDKALALDGEAQIRVGELEQQQEAFRIETNQEIDGLTATLDEYIQQEKIKTIEEAEVKIQELTQSLQHLKDHFKLEPNLTSAQRTEKTKNHNQQVQNMELRIANERAHQLERLDARLQEKRDELRGNIERLKQALALKKRDTNEAVLAIRQQVNAQVAPAETKFQRAALVYISKAVRKIEAKKAEDAANANAKQPIVKKQRRRRKK